MDERDRERIVMSEVHQEAAGFVGAAKTCSSSVVLIIRAERVHARSRP